MIVFGKDAKTNNPLSVSLESLHAGSYILGLPGTGKSTLLNSLATELMKQGESVIVFDPKGDLVDGIIGTMPPEAVENTYLLDLTNDDWPFALNVFSYPDPKNISKKDRAATPNLIFQALQKRWPEVENGRYFKNILLAIIPVLLEHPQFSLLHVRKFLRDEQFRKAILKDITDTESLDFWDEFDDWSPSEQRKERKPFLDRMNELFRDPYVKYIICQKQGLVDFRQAIIQKKHFLIKLPILEAAYQYAGKTIGIFLLLQIYAATFSFASIPQSRRPKFTLIIDEFSQFAFGGEEFRDLFNFGRGLGIRQILAHQTREQLKTDESLKPIVGITKGARTVVCLRLNPIDASDMASIFTGLTRRPTDIYIDVLDRLEKHPDAKVKEFYWHQVSKLQQAAKQTEREGYRNTFDFGSGGVEYKPTQAKECERLLNNALYYAQKEQRLDESRLKAFLTSYAIVCIGPEKRKRIEQIDKQMTELDGKIQEDRKEMQREREKIPAKREEVIRVNQRTIDNLHKKLQWLDNAGKEQFNKEMLREFIPSITEMIEAYSEELNVYFELLREFPLSEEEKKTWQARLNVMSEKAYDGRRWSNYDNSRRVLFGGWLGIPEAQWQGFSHQLLLITQVAYLAYERDLTWIHHLPSYDRVIGFNVTFFIHQFLPPSTDPHINSLYRKLREKLIKRHQNGKAGPRNHPDELFKREYSLAEQRRILQHTLAHEEKFLAEFKAKNAQEYFYPHSIETKINGHSREKDALQREKDTILSITRDVERNLRLVIGILIQQPLAADKSELSSSDVEALLQNLPLRQAYVKSESQIDIIRTYDLPPGLPWSDFRKRKDQIIAQTKKKHCNGRASIEKELAKIFQDLTHDRVEEEPSLSRKPENKTKPQIRVDEDDDIIE